METLLSFTYIFQGVLFLLFIIGLIKPKWILGWLKDPSRGTVVGFYIVLAVITGFMSAYFDINIDRSEIVYKEAESLFKNGQPEDAQWKLNEIKKEQSYYKKGEALSRKIDSIEQKKIEQERIQNARRKDSLLYSSLNELTIKLKKNEIDWDKYKGSLDDLNLQVILFSTYGEKYLEGITNDQDSIKDAAKKFKVQLERVQKREFPKLRSSYAALINGKLWEHDIKAKSLGRGSKRIRFIGGTFAANRNKKDFQNQLSDILYQFRFTRSEYLWYDGDDEYTYYTMKPEGDEELVQI